MTDCVTLWVGDRLGAVERACLRSALGQGHRVALYAYRAPDGVPAGVELRDAAEILPRSLVFRHRRGSIAPFSDWFRYELQRRGLGTWIDTDMYLLAPLDDRRPNLFGEQEPGLINNAILRLAPDSPMLPLLLGPFEQGTVPAWLRPRDYWLARGRRLVSGRADFSAMPWGATGPGALTAVAERLGLSNEALPADIFYPVRWRQAGWILDPTVDLADMISDRTVAVHLWNDCIREFKDEPAPAGSFLDRLQREGAPS